MKINFQTLLDDCLKQISDSESTPSLLLHACCAPCSTYVLEYLSEFFEITVYFYNPNITPADEFFLRAGEIKKLLSVKSAKNKISFICADYEPEKFKEATRGLETEKEGGGRCRECFKLRLGETAAYAKQNKFDFFTTTLSISPHKNAAVLNEIGVFMGEQYDVKYLFADFKKKEGYKRSIELSKVYNLYRQDYCGCEFSIRTNTAD